MGLIHDNAACNALLLLPIEPFPQLEDKSTIHTILAIIIQIRASLTRLRDIDILSTYFAQATALMGHPSFMENSDMANLPPEYMLFNSTWRYEFFPCSSIGLCAY
jgi:hypothetical protein